MSDEAPIETCREWLRSKHDTCKEPAAFVLWGKLLPPEAMGPRCMDHARKHIPSLPHLAHQYAVLDLRDLRRVESRRG